MGTESDRVFCELQFILGSQNRIRLLQHLHEQPATGYELTQSLDVSRATVTRTLSEFRARGWVRQTVSGYEVTDFGVVVADAVDQLYGTMETVLKLDSVREWLPLRDIDFDISSLGDVTLVVSTPVDPFNTLRHITRCFRRAESIRAIVPTLRPESLEVAYPLADSNKTFEAVVSSNVIDMLQTDLEFQEQVADVIRRDSVRLYRYEGELPNYGVIIADDCFLWHLYDENGLPRALIESRDETAIQWGNDKFMTYRAEGELVTF